MCGFSKLSVRQLANAFRLVTRVKLIAITCHAIDGIYTEVKKMSREMMPTREQIFLLVKEPQLPKVVAETVTEVVAAPLYGSDV